MVSDSIQPTVLLLGAKSIASPLDSVPVELSAINQIFEEHQSDSLSFKIKYEPYLTLELLKTQLEKLAGQVTILHFAGHSDEASLQTDDEIVYAQHIADILETWTIQPALIFLNGCHNEEQVKLFLDADVAIVIATHRPIDDKQASGFACEFYQSLFAENGEVILQDAFDRAGAKVFLNQKGQPRSLNYESLDKTEAGNWDWGLFSSHPEYLEQWTIKQLISKNRPRLDTRGNLLNPYKGLEAFKEADKNWFFGRETQTIELTQEIQNTCFLTLMGASGSGKSSLINAGVIPCLRQEEDSLILQIRPGDSPISELARTFAKSLYPDSVSQRLNEQKALSAQLAKQQITISDLIHSLLQQTEKTKLYLFIDQFEELFTQSETPIVHDYLHQLIQLINSDVSCTLVVIMRADFLSSALANTEFATLMDNYPDKLLSPMSPAELREAIEKPANIQHVKLELALVEGLLDDIKSQPGYLPLLQYALSLLWQKRKNNHIKLEDYNASGGLEKALESRANEIYQTFTKKQKKHCKQIFLRLIQPGEGTEDTRRLASLEEFSDKDNVQDIIKKLVDARLITTQQNRQSEDVFAEVSHEALIKHWSQLRKWITENRDELRTQHQISTGAKEWKEHGRDKAWLFSGSRLAVSENWLSKHAKQTTALEKKFVQAGIKERDRQRKRKRNALIAFLAVLSFATLFAFIQWQSAVKSASDAIKASDIAAKNEQKAKEETEKTKQKILESNYHLAKSYEQKALVALSKGDKAHEKGGSKSLTEYRKAWLYALEAERLELPKDKIALSEILLGKLTNISSRAISPEKKHTPPPMNMGSIDAIAYSSDGTVLAIASGNRIHLFNTKTGLLKQTLEGHSGNVSALKYSPDGTMLASASYDRTVRVWDAKTGQLMQTLEGNTHPVVALAYSPDGSLLASASGGKVKYERSIIGKTTSSGNSIFLWDAKSGQLRHTLEGHTREINELLYSPDGTVLASASDDKTIRLWSPISGKLQQTLEGHRGRVTAWAYSPDGTMLAFASYDNVSVWDAKSGQLRQTLEGQTRGINELLYSPDGTVLVSASRDKTIKLWDAKSGQLRQTLEGHTGRINELLYSPDGTVLASASDDNTIRLWNTESKQIGKVSLIHTLQGAGAIMVLAYSPDGTELVSVSRTQGIQRWDVKSGQLKNSFEGHSGIGRLLVHSPDKTELALTLSYSTDQVIRVRDAKTGQLKHQLEGHSGQIQVLVYSPTDTTLASASNDGIINLWDTQSGQLIHKLEGHSGRIVALAFSPDGTILASASASASGSKHTIQLWDAKTSQLRRALQGHKGSVNELLYSPDGTVLASASDDKTIRLWDPISGKLKQTLEGHRGRVTAWAYSPDGTMLASASYDTLRLWDAKSGQLRQTLEGHTERITELLYSPDGTVLASASDDKTIRLWDARSGLLRQTLEGHKGRINQLLYSPDGTVLASVSNDETIRLWDIKSGQLKNLFEGHSSLIRALVYSSDSETLISTSDKTVRFWDTKPNPIKQTIPEEHSGLVLALAFRLDGSMLATASSDQTIRLWNTRTRELKTTLKGHSDPVVALAYSPDGAVLASASRGGGSLDGYRDFIGGYGGNTDVSTIHLWDTKSGQLKQIIEGHSGRGKTLVYDSTGVPHTYDSRAIYSLAYSPDGATLASGSNDKTIRLWDAKSGQLKQIIEGHSGTVSALVYSPDGSALASASGDKTIRLWDADSGQIKQELEGHSRGINALAYSPDGSVLASASYDKTVKLWDARSGKLKQKLKGYSGSVSALAYRPDGKVLASASSDKSIRFWDVTSEKKGTEVSLKQTIKRNTDGIINALAYSPDGKVLASGSKIIRLWDKSQFTTLKLFYDFNPEKVSAALQFLWEMGLDKNELEFVPKIRTPSLYPIEGYYYSDVQFRPLLDMPKPDESKMDQLVRWLEQQCAYKDKAKAKACQQQ